MKIANGLIEFIKSSPTPYHTVASVKALLRAGGFTEVFEGDVEAFSDGGAHFVVRNQSSIIAFRGKGTDAGFMICASHSDTPTFKVKSELRGTYARLSTEKYGGMIHYTWLDRPLSVAGRIIVRTPDGLAQRLVDLDKDAFVIPSVAIHLNRGVNDGYKFNPASDLLPLSGTASAAKLSEQIAALAAVDESDVVSKDLFLYNRDCGRVVGLSDELLLSPRLDDLACVYTSLCAFLDAEVNDSAVNVLAVFDNEEVGSSTKQGAASTFLDDTLRKIAADDAKYAKMLENSYMVSADNAHAVHPNHPELSDSSDASVLGGGVAVKYNANQRYTTDALSDGIFTILAERSGAKLQRYSNRADQLGGSTLGSISNTRVAVSTIDIGIPQLAMHSANETVALSDLTDMIKVLTELYSSALKMNAGNVKIEK